MQSIEPYPQLLRRLKALPMAGTVLHLGAHPDDEDAGLLAYLVLKYGVRVAYWSATRGEGGQNLVGSYAGDSLGVFRSWESARAREVDGAEAHFGPFIDFGYSKTAAETLRRWDRARVVKEMVRAIRRIQPDVVVSRWTGGDGDEHGHHKAVGAVVAEAYAAAGDPARYRDLAGSGLFPWIPAKLYYSTDPDWQPGQRTRIGARKAELDGAGHAVINTGGFDPVARCSYQSIAWRAFSHHRSQGVGFAPVWGDFFYYYRLADAQRRVETGSAGDRALYAGIDPSLAGLSHYPGNDAELAAPYLGEAVRHGAEAYQKLFAQDLTGAAAALLAGSRVLGRLIEATRCAGTVAPDAAAGLVCYYRRKRRQYEALVPACLGVHLETDLSEAYVVPGQRITVTGQLWNLFGAPIGSPRIRVDAPYEQAPEPAAGAEPESDALVGSIRVRLTVPEGAALSCPPWLREPHGAYCYAAGAGDGSAPAEAAPVSVTAEFEFAGETLRITRPPTKAQHAQPYRRIPLLVRPPIELHPERAREIVSVSSAASELELAVGAVCNTAAGASTGTLRVSAPRGWSVTPREAGLEFDAQRSSARVACRLVIPPGRAPGRYEVRYRVACAGRSYDSAVSTVRMSPTGTAAAPGEQVIREAFIPRPAVVEVDVVDVTFTPGYTVAYLSGIDAPVLATLKRLEVTVHPVTQTDARFADPSAFDVLVIGTNAFITRPGLAREVGRLKDYVAAGGTLIVLHQGYRHEEIDAAPYPFRYRHPHGRVTSPESPVTILAPDDSVFRFPNHVTTADFEGWVRDRGLYFFGEWDSRYRPLLSTHDPGEPAQHGALLRAGFGRGTYVYTGLSFFRQIPAGVHGAIRLFANLLAIPAARVRERVERLQRTYLFGDLAQRELETIARLMHEVAFRDGEVVGREGEPGDELYIVLAGEVEIWKRSEPARPIYVAGAGDLVGELAVLSDIPRSATMRARGEVHLLQVVGAQFKQMMQTHPGVAQGVIRILADKLARNGQRPR